MSLRVFQSILARVYLDPKFRKGLLGGRRRSVRIPGLSADERRTLAGLDRVRLEDFCAGLEAKNSARLQASFRHTSRLLGGRFAALCRDFCARHADLREWPEKLAGFASLLFQEIRADDACPRYAYDLARFECARALLAHWARGGLSPSALGKEGLSRRSRGSFVGRYSYDVLGISGGIRRPRKQPVSILFQQRIKYGAAHATHLER